MMNRTACLLFSNRTPHSTNPNSLTYIDSARAVYSGIDSWIFSQGSWLKFKFKVDNKDAVKLIFRGFLLPAPPEDTCVNRLSVDVNGTTVFVGEFNSSLVMDLVVDIPSEYISTSAENLVEFYYVDEARLSYRLLLNRIALEYFTFDYSNKNWMSRINDTTCLCDISIPGSHDAAAIRKSNIHSAFSCQDRSIWEQLLGGIRIFDIRIKVSSLSMDGLMTCHGN